MAKKSGKIKISRLKRNNHTTNKMKKRGEMKLQRHRAKPQKQKTQTVHKELEYGTPSESGSDDEFGDMLDDEEQAYLMKSLAKNPRLLSSVPEKDVGEFKQPKKRKRSIKPKPDITLDGEAESDSDASSISDMEDKYEQELADRPTKKMRPLLPIKTKQGLMERAIEVEDEESDSGQPPPRSTPKSAPEDSASDSDSGMEDTSEGDGNNDTSTSDGVVTTVQLMAARRDTLNREKLRVGSLCSSLLESPDKKLKNLFPILYLMEEHLKDGTVNLHSIRKIATLSAYEVFKDILPEYQIRHQDYSTIKLKKETLTMYKFEKELLEFYKRYLQKLEKSTSVLRRKKGDNRKPDEASTSLALISLQCMCGLLQAKPHFNYAVNIAQSVIPMLGCKQNGPREIVAECCRQVFANDNKGDITLTIVRLINQLAKKRGDRLHESSLDCLLSLKIKDVELDAAAEVKHKQKQEEKHKKRIVNLSKKEKKRAKKLKEVERELLETQAQESELAHKKQMTEVTKTVFHIYFRILKTSPHSKLLAAVLRGLAKFTHVINLEYYTELVAILAHLLSDDQIGVKEKILCVRTALAILAGAGDALNVDPARFHAYLYESMLNVHAGITQDNAAVILSALTQVCSRARRVSSAVLQSCVKRLSTMALHLQHNGALAALVLMYNLAQQSKAVLSLFEASDEAIGSGRFDPYLNSPEHCNAHSANLHELTLLSRHYHPTTKAVAFGLRGNPPNVLVEFKKTTPLKIYEEYDGTKVAFKPSIPPPNKEVTPKTKIATAHNWVQTSFKGYCLSIADNVDSNVNFTKHLSIKE